MLEQTLQALRRAAELFGFREPGEIVVITYADMRLAAENQHFAALLKSVPRNWCTWCCDCGAQMDVVVAVDEPAWPTRSILCVECDR